MSDLGDRIEKILTGRDGGAGAPPTLRELAQGLRDHFGSGRRAAKELGVNESTFRRILSGRTKAPKAETVGAFDQVGRRVGSRGIDLDAIKIPVQTVKAGRRHGQQRELRARNLKITDPKAADRIRSAYVAGGKEAAAKQLIREIKDPHYRNWLVPDQWRDELAAEVESDYGYAVA